MASQRQDRGWQVGKSLPDRMWHLFENRMCSDVTFVFPGEQTNRIQAHKVVLIAGSPVFEAMFSGNFIETESDVEIVDITPGVFKEFLRYLYTDETHVDAENVLPLMYTAKKYIVDGLNDICGSFLTKEINEENVCKILDDSIEYGVESLTERCLKYILPRAGKVLQTQGFPSISQKALQLIVQSGELDINNETDVYDACIRWASSHSPERPSNQDLRNQLGPCLLQIRFHQMSVDDFANKMGLIDILTDREKSVLYSFLVTKRDDAKQKLQELNFNLGRRNKVGRLEIPCYSPSSDVQIFDGGVEHILNFSLTAGPELWLRGICLYGSLQAGDTDSVTITLSENTGQGGERARVAKERNHKLKQSWNQQDTITWTGNAEPKHVDIKGTRYLVPGKMFSISLKTHDRDVICQQCGTFQQLGHIPYITRDCKPLICQQCGFQPQQRNYHGRNVRFGVVELGDIAFDFLNTFGSNRSIPTRFAELIVSRM